MGLTHATINEDVQVAWLKYRRQFGNLPEFFERLLKRTYFAAYLDGAEAHQKRMAEAVAQLTGERT